MGSREPGKRVPAPEQGQRGGPRQRAWIASGSGHPSNHASAFHETNQGGEGWRSADMEVRVVDGIRGG